MKALSILAIVLLSVSFAWADTPRFATFDKNVNAAFIAYLDALVESREIAPADLSRFATSLREDQHIANPVAAGGATSKLIHAREIELFLRQDALDRAQILRWVRNTLEQHAAVEEERETRSEETRSLDQNMAFARIAKGSFTRDGRKINIDHDFEIMKTTVTHQMWADLMTHPRVISKTPDLPKVFVTWYEAVDFANALSHASGYENSYQIQNGKVVLSDLVRDVYDTEGYRLPTTEEFQFVMSGRGKHEYGRFPGVDEESILDYAWCAENSDSRAREVATQRPCDVDGASIYDLHGNVSQWSHDHTSAIRHLPKGGTCSILLGSDFVQNAEVLFHASIGHMKRGHASPRNGFRLVRTLR